MIARASQFFLREMEAPGVWRYWTSQHPFHKNIPPDTDDLACVSSILMSQGLTYRNNIDLMLANRNDEGLFYTWFAPRFRAANRFARRCFSFWQTVGREAMQPASLYYFWKLNEAKPNDIDAVVNANALYYLWLAKQSGAISDSIYEAAVVPVANYLMDIIREDREELCDKWHLSPFNLYYAVSRNLFAGVEPFRSIEDLLVRKVLRHAR